MVNVASNQSVDSFSITEFIKHNCCSFVIVVVFVVYVKIRIQ